MARQKRTSRRRIYSPQHFQGSRDHHYLHHYPHHRLQIPIRMPTHNLPRQCCNKSRPRRTPNTRRNSAHCYYRICCFRRVVVRRRGIVWGRVSPVIVTEQPHPTKKQEHCAHPQQERSYQHKSQRYSTHSNSSTLQCSTTIRRGPPIPLPPHQHPYHHDDDNERRVIDDPPCRGVPSMMWILPPCYNRCSPPTLWVPLIHTTMHSMRVVPVAVIAIAIAIPLVTRVGVVCVSFTIATARTTTTTAANNSSIRTPIAPPIQYQHILLLLPNLPIHPHDDTLIHG